MIEQAAAPFGGAFLHHCGRHPDLFEMLCRMPCVRAIDLGNPEMYDAAWLMERCAETGTVLYSRLAPEPAESWDAYTRRLGGLVRDTGARCILRPLVYPQTRDECSHMKELWHDLTVQNRKRRRPSGSRTGRVGDSAPTPAGHYRTDDHPTAGL
jgi:hypothetical protein